jgi:hypothetical protein
MALHISGWRSKVSFGMLTRLSNTKARLQWPSPLRRWIGSWRLVAFVCALSYSCTYRNCCYVALTGLVKPWPEHSWFRWSRTKVRGSETVNLIVSHTLSNWMYSKKMTLFSSPSYTTMTRERVNSASQQICILYWMWLCTCQCLFVWFLSALHVHLYTRLLTHFPID